MRAFTLLTFRIFMNGASRMKLIIAILKAVSLVPSIKICLRCGAVRHNLMKSGSERSIYIYLYDGAVRAPYIFFFTQRFVTL